VVDDDRDVQVPGFKVLSAEFPLNSSVKRNDSLLRTLK
jgi:hypothetical protein